MIRWLSILLTACAALFFGGALWEPVPVIAQEIMPTPTPTPTPPPAPTYPISPVGVAASTHDGNLPSNTLDGSLSTRWAGFGDGAWIEYDLGSTAKVAAIKVAVFRGDTRSNIFDVLLSTDRQTWTPVRSTSSSGTTTALENHDFVDQDARYVRYVGHGNASNGVIGGWNSVTEVALLSTQSSDGPTPQRLQAATIHDMGAIYLVWQPAPAPAPATSIYRVYRSLRAGGPYTHVGTTTEPRFTNFGLANGVRYCYVVTGVGATESRYSNESCAVATVMPTPTPRPRPTPGAPTNLVAQHGALDCEGAVMTPLRLTWSPSNDADGYHVYRTVAQQPPAHVATVLTTAWSTTDPRAGGSFFVVAFNSGGVSDPSNHAFATFIIPGCPPPVEITPPASAVTASTHDGNVPANVVDNDLGTRWSGAGDGATLTFDLGRTRRVTGVRIAVFRGDQRRNAFAIEVATDPQQWTTLWSGQSAGNTTALEWYNLRDTDARYVRYVGRRATANTGEPIQWNSVTEVDILGY